MENVEELVPFVKEMLSQKPSRGLLKVYLVGSVLALLGTVIGLVETVCHPFSSAGTTDADLNLLLSQRQRLVNTELQRSMAEKEEEEEKEKEKEEEEEEEEKGHTSMIISKMHRKNQRTSANRLHAS